MKARAVGGLLWGLGDYDLEVSQNRRTTLWLWQHVLRGVFFSQAHVVAVCNSGPMSTVDDLTP